jgi:hypothetical protein
MTKLTQERLKELLHYDSKTGIWTWLVWRGNKVQRGSLAGSPNDNGYRCIQIDGAKYLSSRLAVLYITGCWPKQKVDHRDHNTLNDRWRNLRHASHPQNQWNARKRIDNTSGFKGVSKEGCKWRAQIRAYGVHYYLGTFKTREEAYAVRCAKAKELHGEFMCAA